MASKFSMTKLYFDCVADDGEAAIAYCADLRWHGIRTSIGSLLESHCGEAPCTRTALGMYKVSDAAGDLALELPRLGVTGRWQSAAPSFNRTVYESPSGSVKWNCLQPAAQAELQIGDRILRGAGYAESLTLTVAPWRLPLRQLRWGRFVSARHALAWIDWQGPHAMSLALLDGCAAALHSTSPAEVVAGDASLRIEPGECLRTGTLASTILPGAPALARIFPRSLFNVVEQKWKSRGVLRIAGEEIAGWVIHELVRWPGEN